MIEKTVGRAKLNWDLSKTIYVSKNENDNIYSEEFERAYSAIRDIADSLAEKAGKSFDSDKDAYRVVHDCRNTVIGIAGERGSGKSSFIHSLNAHLKANEDFESVYSLGCIEPSNFSSRMNILELFLTKMYTVFKDDSQSSNDVASLYNSPQINSTFKKISQVLSSLHVNESKYAEQNPGIEILSNMKKLTDMRVMIGELCSQFLQICNSSKEPNESRKTSIALFIDDADLTSNKEIYRLLEDVRKYLSGNVIVVIAYRQQQLIDSVLDHLIHENKDLIDRKALVASALRSQAEDFIEKVIPKDRTIALYSQSDLMNSRLQDVLRGLDRTGEIVEDTLIDGYRTLENDASSAPLVEMDASITVEDWLDKALFRKTMMGIKPVNGQENVSFVWPKNLRELLTLGQIIDEQMPDPWQQGALISSYEQCAKNLDVYKSYFIGNLMETLDSEKIESLSRWLSASADEKNYVAYSIVYKMLYSKIKDAKSYPNNEGPVTEWAVADNLLSIDLMHPRNVAVGDVYMILGKYISSSFDNELDVFFGYAFKTLYSIELLGLVLQLLQLDDMQSSTGAKGANQANASAADPGQDRPEGQKAWSQYLKLINMSVLPPEEGSNDLTQIIDVPSKEEFNKIQQNLVLILNDLSEGQEMATLVQSEGNDKPDFNLAGIKEALGKLTWDGFSIDQFGAITLDEYKTVLGLFISPTTTQNGIVSRSSRPMRTDVLSLEKGRSEGLRGARQYNTNYNRLIFWDSAKHDIEEYHSYSNGRYSINLLNVFANPIYLKSALQAARERSRNAYVFYSLFDLDVFNTLTYDLRRGYDDLINQVKRLNSAFTIAMSKDGDQIEYDADMIRIGIEYEKSLFHRLKVPFVLEGVSPSKYSDLLVECFESISAQESPSLALAKMGSSFDILKYMFRLSEVIPLFDSNNMKHDRLKRTERVIQEVRNASGAQAIGFLRPFMERLTSRRRHSDARSIQEIVEALESNKPFAKSRKNEVARIIENNGFEAWAAYKKWNE